MKIRSIFFICVLMSINACKTEQTISNNPLAIVYANYQIDTTRLSFDGMYNVYDTVYSQKFCENADKVLITNHEVVFLKNGSIHRSSGVSTDSITFDKSIWIRSAKKFNYLWGRYWIIGDSIYAHTPLEMHVRGGRIKPFNANFSGYILNKDTILAWRMVKPYPDVNPEWNYGFVNDTTPRTLYFIKNDAVKCLDSLLAQ